MEFWLPYGVTEVPVAIPDENLLGFLRPLEGSVSENVEEVLAVSLKHPMGDKTLHEAASRAKKTVIAFDADSALCSSFANLLAKELLHANASLCLLERGADPTQSHSSPAVSNRNQEAPCPLMVHDPKASAGAKVGQLDDGTEIFLNEAFASAEIRCVVTNVAVNPFWGYSGGPSFLVPGLASEKTVKSSLRSTLRSPRLPGVLSGNPTYETLLRVSQIARVDFAIHIVERPDGKIAGIFAGDFLQTFQQACVVAGRIFRPPIQRKADIIISSAGGVVWDRTLFDASRSAIMTASGCKDHGIMIIVAECANGLGKFPSVGSASRESKVRAVQAQRAFTLERLVEYSIQRLVGDHRVYLVSTLPEHDASLYGLLAAKSVGSAFQRAVRHAGKDAKVALIPYGCHTAPLVG